MKKQVTSSGDVETITQATAPASQEHHIDANAQPANVLSFGTTSIAGLVRTFPGVTLPLYWVLNALRMKPRFIPRFMVGIRKLFRRF
ncbi:hypothetical protein E2C01_076394 [Portunus trituberculatus]|uniref:Uncharacterized protein n=1 Tax=Portunus trituberculatus TaxID=210409 RepID=A0A5B7I8M3_PORTR|nr:hypothetical protein [Portunus trituberculatus]